MKNVYQNVYNSMAEPARRPPVMVNPEALTSEQFSNMRENMSSRFQSHLPTPQQPPAPRSAVPSSPRAAQHRVSNQAPRAHQPPPGIVDADYFAGAYLDVTG